MSIKRDQQLNVRVASTDLEKLRVYAWTRGPGVTASDVIREYIKGLPAGQKSKKKR